MMKDIGLKLRTEREQQGLSLQELSEKTKITVSRLKAIEDGDIDYFSDDISYLRYYVRFYSHALNLDFETLREPLQKALDAYEGELQNTITAEHRKIEQNVQNAADYHNRGKHKTDFSLLSLIAVIGLLVITLGFVFFRFILPEWRNPQSDPVIVDPIVEPSDPIEEPTEPTDPVTPVVQVVTINKVGDREYEITNWNAEESVSIKLTVGTNETWVRFRIDTVVTNNPASGIYQPNAVVELLYTPVKDSVVELKIGRVLSNTILINDKPLEIDEKYATSDKALTLTLTFKGE